MDDSVNREKTSIHAHMAHIHCAGLAFFTLYAGGPYHPPVGSAMTPVVANISTGHLEEEAANSYGSRP